MAINILTTETINKIAAGEVVERPLNVVKELVENSLDACASHIDVEILQAGRKLIRVSDNGLGMDRQDLELSTLRHATSKISDFNDLPHIQSLGFRGEALSSIAAVSEMEIITRKKDAEDSWELKVSGDKEPRIFPASASQGTIIEIKNLFFNTPVREKFLKSDTTEKGRIIACVEESALANSDVAFKMISDNKVVFAAPKTQDKIERFSDILGKDFALSLKKLKIGGEKIEVEIFFTDASHPQPTRKFQYLFVNSRPVNLPRWFVSCINNSYKEVIPNGKFPGFLVYIYIPSEEIDVNIHPTKREIKFSNEKALYDAIFHSLRSALLSFAPSEIRINDNAALSTNLSNPLKISHQEPSLEKKSGVGSNFDGRDYIGEPRERYKVEDYAEIYVQTKFEKADFDDSIKVIGQVFETYIIAQKDETLYIFDQHAAQERIIYEQYLDQIDVKNLKIQTLLIPETFELPPSMAVLLKSNASSLNDLGIAIEEFGENSFRITAYPALLGDISIETVTRKIIEDLDADKTIDENAALEHKMEKIIRSACKASIKAGDFLAPLEAKKLIQDLFKCKQPLACPHGRPTAYTFSKDEIEKYFKRK
jgi:DNA mismatch repair protein MutL